MNGFRPRLSLADEASRSRCHNECNGSAASPCTGLLNPRPRVGECVQRVTVRVPIAALPLLPQPGSPRPSARPFLAEYDSWTQWGLETAVGLVYTFGFATMTPQLYVNYRLRSVAHLPWRGLVYRSVNTFIDDLFAVVIRMPWLHRISVLRDGVCAAPPRSRVDCARMLGRDTGGVPAPHHCPRLQTWSSSRTSTSAGSTPWTAHAWRLQVVWM